MINLLPLLVLIKIIDLCYLFQTKEYRFDRFRSMLFEIGLIRTLYLRRVRLPARTARNFLIMIISTGVLIMLLTFYVQLFYGVFELTTAIFLSPVIALCLVSIGVIATRPMAYVVRKRLINAAQQKLKPFHGLLTIGISGSYGKTSTKEFLYQMLSTKFPTAKTDKNQNTDVGVATSILKNVHPNTKYFIGEVGAYKKGEVRQASQLFHPQYAIITGFGNQHLDLYGSRQNLIDTESEILEILPSEGTAYINADIPSYAIVAKKTKADKVSYSMKSQKATIYAHNIRRSSKGHHTAEISYEKRRFTISTTLIGRHNLENILPCIAFCLDQGMTTNEVIFAVKELRQVEGKLSRHTGPNGCTVLNDTGNSSVDGFVAALQTVEDQEFEKNVVVSKGIIELGNEKKISYKRVLSTIIHRPIHLYTTDKLFNKLGLKDQVHIFESEDQLLKEVLAQLDRETLLLVEGKFTPRFIKSLILI